MQVSTMPEIEFQLRKLYTRYSEYFMYHQWPSEHARWVELAFALVSKISEKPEAEVREAVEDLDELRLLETEKLAAVVDEDGLDMEHTDARRILESLTESDFSEEGAKNSLRAIAEAASSLEVHHGGKIQRYLRHYGQLMLEELPRHFTFSQMGDADVKEAFTYWLQNVLDMPVSLESEEVKTFCRNLEIDIRQLEEEADRQEINLALLDDMITQYIADQK